MFRMLTTVPHLRTRRPSPTTVEFIVSTIPPQTLALRLVFLATFLLRVLLGLSTLLLLYSKWSLSPYAAPVSPSTVLPPFYSNEFIWYSIHKTHKSPLGILFTSL